MGKWTGKCDGFSLLELMVSVAILLVVAGAAFSFLISYQNYYQSTALHADMHASLRGATELMEQDIGQAGTVSLGANCSAAMPTTTLTTATTGCPTLTGLGVSAGATTANVTSTTGMFNGESLLVDLGSNQETVQINAAVTSSTSISTTAFANNHSGPPTGAVVSAVGVFPQGILCDGANCGGCTVATGVTPPGTCTGANATSTSTDMYLFGDIHGDGTLVFVHYYCNVTGGTLTRSDTALTATTESTPVTLLDNITSNPNGTPCFQYTGNIQAVGATNYTFATSVSVTLTVKTSELDPVTKTYSQETKSFMNLAPRNIFGGYNMATAKSSTYLQPEPAGNCLLQLTCTLP